MDSGSYSYALESAEAIKKRVIENVQLRILWREKEGGKMRGSTGILRLKRAAA